MAAAKIQLTPEEWKKIEAAGAWCSLSQQGHCRFP
jgi:hypothetical protein